MANQDDTKLREKAPRDKGQNSSCFTARVHQEGAWFIAQAVEVDVASQGESEGEALANLREALELYFMPDGPTSPEDIPEIGVTVATT